jgi:hypothetical protein
MKTHRSPIQVRLGSDGHPTAFSPTSRSIGPAVAPATAGHILAFMLAPDEREALQVDEVD